MSEQSFIAGHRHAAGGSFWSRTLAGLLDTVTHALDAERVAARPGWLQGLDARSKLLGLGFLIVCTVTVHHLLALAWLFVLAVLLSFGAGVTLRRLWRQAWLSVLLFTGLIALPALFLVPGPPLAVLPVISQTGLRSALFLLGRAETSATLALLIMLSTPWPQLLKGLRALRVPVVLVAILGMTHRYLFTLLTSTQQLLEARSSRQIGPLSAREKRRQLAACAGTLLERSLALSQEIHLAMLARGYRGEIHLLQAARPGWRDLAALLLFVSAGLLALTFPFV
ncbi:cobalt ECF transporter T component CbiQ [Paludibacterium sp. B53371]|uniref:cobalt ECF transporter T component CbiQ n=1 Tax=Paludibacterium sp. B53371 TaxID=2806263 RepID=UPI001C040D7B|nr:cobalt ECF transporter T component CbiQ [Paludibacterium sp. B53371]